MLTQRLRYSSLLAKTQNFIGCQQAARQFSYDYREIKALNAQLQRKLNVLKMFTDYKDFNYEQPDMTYDKKTGNVTIIEAKDKVKAKKKLIRSIDEVNEQKQKLYKELGLESDGLPQDSSSVNSGELTQKLTAQRIKDSKPENHEYEYDPSQFYCFSRDMMRVDVGLMIQRPPIFVHMRDNDKNFMASREKIMEEYYCDSKQFIDEFNEVAKLNEDCLTNNPYVSRMNLDNYPSHQKKDPQTGEMKQYCAASKNWQLVDPRCSDRKSLHYAGEDRIFLIVKNKFTNEWEFPITQMNMGQTFFRAKVNLFEDLTSNKWRIKFFGSSPLLHTLREFTPIEREDPKNTSLKGVRTFWFGAHHLRGIPEMSFVTNEDGSEHPENFTNYNDWLWVPKRELNKYFEKDYYEIFQNVCKTY